MEETNSRWGEYVQQRLDKLSVTAPKAAEAARKFAEKTFLPSTPTPNVVQNNRQSISFTWHKNGLDVEIEIRDNGKGGVWIHRRVVDYSVLEDLPHALPLVQDALRILEGESDAVS